MRIHVDPRITAILRIMAERAALGSRLTCEEAGSLVGISPMHLSRIFRRNTGISFSEFSRRLRMQHSITLLSDWKQPVKQVAFDCGYNDVSNFYRDFRQAYGTTPGSLKLAIASENSFKEGPLTNNQVALVVMKRLDPVLSSQSDDKGFPQEIRFRQEKAEFDNCTLPRQMAQRNVA